ncbi:MAG: DUF2188 domain-containing protein [Chloroflexota bacterium]|nr:DUF2188 domain-containing protein [Chloroflexota bacterium]
MAGQKRVTVTSRAKGGWTVEGGASGTHKTQAAAIKAARAQLNRTGGGELQIKGRNGRVRAQSTIGRKAPRGSKG